MCIAGPTLCGHHVREQGQHRSAKRYVPLRTSPRGQTAMGRTLPQPPRAADTFAMAMTETSRPPVRLSCGTPDASQALNGLQHGYLRWRNARDGHPNLRRLAQLAEWSFQWDAAARCPAAGPAQRIGRQPGGLAAVRAPRRVDGQHPSIRSLPYGRTRCPSVRPSLRTPTDSRGKIECGHGIRVAPDVDHPRS